MKFKARGQAKHLMIAFVILGAAAEAAAQSTGYPACDRYISMVTECIKTKMPPSDRADAQGQLDAFRGALGFIGGDRAAKACEENIRIEMQRDKYGCYAARASASGVRTACSLVTPADLQTALGVAFGPGVPGNSKCRFDAAAPPPKLVEIEVSWNDGAAHMKSWREAAAQWNPSVVSAATVVGLADDGFYVVMGHMPMLAVRKGDVAVSVMALGSLEQLLAIARKALERIP